MDDHLTKAQKGQAKRLGLSIEMGDGIYKVTDNRDPGNKPQERIDLGEAINAVLATRAPEAIAEIQHPAIGDGPVVSKAVKKKTDAALKKAAKKLAKKEKKPVKAKAKPRMTMRQKLDAEARGEDTGIDEEEDDEGEEKATSSIVRDRYKKAYQPNGGNCGDDMAAAFKEAVTNEDGDMDYDALVAIGNQNDIEVRKRWGKLNNGQQRMNLSNVLRGLIRKGTDVKVGRQTFKGDEQVGKPKKAPKKKAVTLKEVENRKVSRGALSQPRREAALKTRAVRKAG